VDIFSFQNLPCVHLFSKRFYDTMIIDKFEVGDLF